jgi:hypothetical protein
MRLILYRIVGDTTRALNTCQLVVKWTETD